MQEERGCRSTGEVGVIGAELELTGAAYCTVMSEEKAMTVGQAAVACLSSCRRRARRRKQHAQRPCAKAREQWPGHACEEEKAMQVGAGPAVGS